jgi:hypothetical protein
MSTPARAAVNGQIAAVAFGDQLVTINPDGSGYAPRYVAQAGESLLEPAWSPDGNRIAFELVGAEGRRIYIYDLATGTANSGLAASAVSCLAQVGEVAASFERRCEVCSTARQFADPHLQRRRARRPPLGCLGLAAAGGEQRDEAHALSAR